MGKGNPAIQADHALRGATDQLFSMQYPYAEAFPAVLELTDVLGWYYNVTRRNAVTEALAADEASHASQTIFRETRQTRSLADWQRALEALAQPPNTGIEVVSEEDHTKALGRALGITSELLRITEEQTRHIVANRFGVPYSRINEDASRRTIADILVDLVKSESKRHGRTSRFVETFGPTSPLISAGTRDRHDLLAIRRYPVVLDTRWDVSIDEKRRHCNASTVSITVVPVSADEGRHLANLDKEIYSAPDNESFLVFVDKPENLEQLLRQVAQTATQLTGLPLGPIELFPHGDTWGLDFGDKHYVVPGSGLDIAKHDEICYSAEWLGDAIARAVKGVDTLNLRLLLGACNQTKEMFVGLATSSGVPVQGKIGVEVGRCRTRNGVDEIECQRTPGGPLRYRAMDVVMPDGSRKIQTAEPPELAL